jgi:hypothetical protein
VHQLADLALEVAELLEEQGVVVEDDRLAERL